ncbi:Transposon Tn7 transposition protein TnsC [Pseudomonas syringae pv. philadelphi]|uniref:Transposon Tn7 transposition protein TnsC n=1 Tax=Pseudomonas syringae pv. philadelphi TaxID=251706 RepID=A0A3M3ZQP9_9PSED|nr:ATP-binding protein [Pseudomonas syringae group genomosp. 3]RMO97002.1 Transposon Tn7 transposition protein TnsC [Pseudomonas syringae pv. philadelphi]
MPPIELSNHADYKTIGIDEIDSNPLISHLVMPPENDREAILRLGLKPEYSPEERMLPAFARRLKINRLRHFFAPTQQVHRQALIGISSQVFDGYISRNPMTAQGQRILYGHSADISVRPTISLIAGHSGMGKSTLLDRLLSGIGNQDYQHTKFREVPFCERQLLWLRRNVPEHCTVRTLCASFGDYTDRILGLSLYHGIFQNLRGGDRNYYLSEIRKIVTNHHVGVLVLDEFQNLSLMGVGAAKIIAFLVNLRDELGLPIVIAGTYKALRLLEGDLSIARRLVEGGYYDLKRPGVADDESFVQLCKIVWPYQWTRIQSECSDSVIQSLYDVSQGITGIMLSVIITAQLAAIEDRSEQINENMIFKVFKERMKPLHSAIDILKSKNPRLLDTFDEAFSNSFSDTAANNYTTRAHLSKTLSDRTAKTEIEPSSVRSESLETSYRSSSGVSTLKMDSDEIRKLVMENAGVSLAKLLD